MFCYVGQVWSSFCKKSFLEFVLYLPTVLAGHVFVIYAVKLDDESKTLLLLNIQTYIAAK